MGQSRPLFVYFRYFLISISIIQIEKSIYGVLGIRTRGCRMVGIDKTTELWRPPSVRHSILALELLQEINPIREHNDDEVHNLDKNGPR